MLADIKGKISRTGSNLNDRLEDNLTGNIFGTLRYMPFSSGLGRVLANGVFPESTRDEICKIRNDFWGNNIQFWPYDPEGEIDVLIEFDEIVIGIEVKFMSGLSSDDEIANGDTQEEKKKQAIKQSSNQLARESRIISRKGQNKTKLLLFLADRKSCKAVFEDVTNRNIIEKDVQLGYLSWQDFLNQLKTIRLTDPFQQTMIQDLIGLLIKKGFEDFNSMKVETTEPIQTDEYFLFDVDIQKHTIFSFETNLLINEGDYYEFSK